MSVTIRKASQADAPILTNTRLAVWEQTYRGIYPDSMIDKYDYDAHLNRDKQLLSSREQHYYLFMDGRKCVGYFSFGPYNYGKYKDFDLCLNSLYLCQEYKGHGLGKKAFSMIRNHAQQHGITKFFCGCNTHNYSAQGFYRHMGGIVGAVSCGHDNKADDIMHFEFYLGE